MKLIRTEDRKNGIRYMTFDNESHMYRIRKFYKKAHWELSEVTGHGYKIIGYYKYFKDAKQHLKSICEVQ